VSILPHNAKALLELFCLQPIVFCKRQNSSSSSIASWGKIEYMILHWRIGLMLFKIFAIRTVSDSILSNQNWTRTEKFHSLLICATHTIGLNQGEVSRTLVRSDRRKNGLGCVGCYLPKLNQFFVCAPRLIKQTLWCDLDNNIWVLTNATPKFEENRTM